MCSTHSPAPTQAVCGQCTADGVLGLAAAMCRLSSHALSQRPLLWPHRRAPVILHLQPPAVHCQSLWRAVVAPQRAQGLARRQRCHGARVGRVQRCSGRWWQSAGRVLRERQIQQLRAAADQHQRAVSCAATTLAAAGE